VRVTDTADERPVTISEQWFGSKIARVIDLANPVTWPGIVAHIRAEDGPAGPIHVFSTEQISCDQPLDLRRGSCRASVTCALDDRSEAIVFIVGHVAGCPVVPDMLALAGKR
jgi:hypothetical protein